MFTADHEKFAKIFIQAFDQDFGAVKRSMLVLTTET